MAVGASSNDLNRRLRSILDAFAIRGMGPAEATIVDALAFDDPARVRAALVGLEAIYPPDLRRFLDERGLGRLYRDDLSRAVDRLEKPRATPAGQSSLGGGRGRSRRGRAGPWLLILLGAGIVGGALWQLSKALPDRSVTTNPLTPAAPTAPAVPEPIVTPMEPVCRARLKSQALSWCAQSLAGPGGGAQTPDWAALADCGDALDLSSRTVRMALDGLFEDGAAETYARTEVASRCERAAEQAIRVSERGEAGGGIGSRRR